MNNPWRKLSGVPDKLVKKVASKGLPQNDRLLQPHISKFLTPEECMRLVTLGEENATFTGATQAGEVQNYRSSNIIWLFPSKETNWIFNKIDTLVLTANKGFQYDLLGFFSGIQIATYTAGGHYNWHMDTGRGDTSNRKLSVTVQLSPSTDYTEGDLEFMASGCPDYEKEMMRSQGTATVFPSFLNHRVRPIKEGVRRSMVAWISGPPYR